MLATEKARRIPDVEEPASTNPLLPQANLAFTEPLPKLLLASSSQASSSTHGPFLSLTPNWGKHSNTGCSIIIQSTYDDLTLMQLGILIFDQACGAYPLSICARCYLSFPVCPCPLSSPPHIHTIVTLEVIEYVRCRSDIVFLSLTKLNLPTFHVH